MIIDCDRLWTRLVTFVYRLRRLPRVTNRVPRLPPIEIAEHAALVRPVSPRAVQSPVCDCTSHRTVPAARASAR